MSTALLNLLFAQTIYKYANEGDAEFLRSQSGEPDSDSLTSASPGPKQKIARMDQFERLAKDLENHPLNTAFHLNAKACQSLYTALLPNTPGRPSVDLLRPLIQKLFESYKRDIIQQIRRDEQEYQARMQDIEALEGSGALTKELLQELEASTGSAQQQQQLQQLRLQKQLEIQQKQEQDQKMQLQKQQLQKQKQLERQQMLIKQEQQKKERERMSKETEESEKDKDKDKEKGKQLKKIPDKKEKQGEEEDAIEKALSEEPELEDVEMKDAEEMAGIEDPEEEEEEAEEEDNEEGEVEERPKKPELRRTLRSLRNQKEEEKKEEDEKEAEVDVEVEAQAHVEDENSEEKDKAKGKDKAVDIKDDTEATEEELEVEDRSGSEPEAKLKGDTKGAAKVEALEDTSDENSKGDDEDDLDGEDEEEDEGDEEDNDSDNGDDDNDDSRGRSASSKRGHARSISPSFRKFQQVIMPLLSDISSNKSASLFMHPVNPNDAPNYYDIIKSPTDLRTIRAAVRTGEIRNTAEVERELQKMFANSIMYNSWDSDVSMYAKEMQQEVESLLQLFHDAERGGAVASVDDERTKRRKKQ